MLDIYSVTPVVEIDFPFPSRYKLKINPWLEVGLCVPFPFLDVLDLGLVKLGQVLCAP